MIHWSQVWVAAGNAETFPSLAKAVACVILELAQLQDCHAMHSENRGPNDVNEREPLAGLVERVTFHNPDNGFCVLRVKVR